MKLIKIIEGLLILSVCLVLFVCLSYLLIKSDTEVTEPATEVMVWTPRSDAKKSTRPVMRVPNNKLLASVKEKQRRSAIVPYAKNRGSLEKSTPRPIATTNVIRMIQGSPRFPNIQDAVLELDTNKYSCNDSTSMACVARTNTFGDLLQKELNRVVTYESRISGFELDKQNSYAAHFGGVYGKRMSREEARCALAGVRVRTVTGRDEPSRRLGLHVPPAPLREGRTYNTCAVVSSAGSLLGSRLGEYIDSHEMVLRFNNAPTENYTEDVGSKTTFRILNSQVVTKQEYNFLEDPLYLNVSVLIWDPAQYAASLGSWYEAPDYPVFDYYKRFLELNPHNDVHLLKPEVLWELWNVLQASAINRLRRNPPSSGFIGIWFAMHRCESVSVVEYVPSTRATERCHYYRPHRDRACTLGSWHPLAQEKNLVNLIRDNSDFEAYQRGFIHIPGVSALDCPD